MVDRGISDGKANCFLVIAITVLMLNFMSQVAAFPFQVMLIIYAVVKSDIKLFPGLFVALLDKSCFPDLGAELLKFRVGIALGAENVFLIAVFITVVYRIVKNHYQVQTMLGILLFWLSALIPAWVIAGQAKTDGLGSWQEALVCFLTPALFFWGWSVGRTWGKSRLYFIKCMSILFLVLNVLSVGKHYYVFSFVCGPLSVGLAAAAILGRCSLGCRILALGCCATGLADAMFGRYINMKEKTGFADATELGSTFTVVMTIIFCFAIAALASMVVKRPKTIRLFPIMFMVPLVVVFFYATGRASSNSAINVKNDYRNIVERFEFKLIGDRGGVWADGMKDAVSSPLFFKRYRDRLVSAIGPNGEHILVMKMPPHNQILTLLVSQGWWLGLFCIIFLFWTHFKMFNRMSFMMDDKIMICSLLAPSAAVFYAVGLTGQSVWSAAFTGNGLVTLIFPGVICGAWQAQRWLRR